MSILKEFFVFLLIMNAAACTWVDVSKQGEKVRVLTAEDVTLCERVGKTTVKTAGKLAGFERHEYKVRDELDTLARNSAVEIAGDTVVAVGEPVDGGLVYEVYRCMPK